MLCHRAVPTSLLRSVNAFIPSCGIDCMGGYIYFKTKGAMNADIITFISKNVKRMWILYHFIKKLTMKIKVKFSS